MDHTFTAPRNVEEFNQRYPQVLAKLVNLNLHRLFHTELQNEACEYVVEHIDAQLSSPTPKLMSMNENEFKLWFKVSIAIMVKEFVKTPEPEVEVDVAFTASDVAFLKTYRITAELG